MNVIQRIILAVSVLVLSAALSGCNEAVRFGQHSPYATRYGEYEAPLVVVLPNGTIDEKYDVHYGRVWGFGVHDIYYGEALQYEIEARFLRLFSDVVVLTERDYAEARGEEVEPLPPKEQKARDKRVEEDEEFLVNPEFVEEDIGYLLRFTDIKFTVAQERPAYQTNIELIDRFTGQSILAARAGAQGPPIEIEFSRSRVNRSAKEETIAACNNLLIQIQEKVVQAIENPPPPDKPT